jgi:hypothetical protein
LVLSIRTLTTLAESLPATVEDVVNRSDIIVLGKVTSTDPAGIEIGLGKQLFTRNTFRVEEYYKGSGASEISVFTAGGFETRMDGGRERKVWTQVAGSEQVKVGDELVVFLKAVPGGFVFIEWDGAKYPVYLDGPEGERKVNLRLRKQRYMKGTALQGFNNLARLDGGPDAGPQLEEKLRGTKGIEEVVAVKDLHERLSDIVRGEEPSR